MANTAHALIRSAQRGLPPFVSILLDEYGHNQYDGHGAIVRYFDKQSRRRMERALGKEPVRRFSDWLDAYKVISCADGATITLGHRYRRIPRR